MDMRANWLLSLGCAAGLAVACGGGVSLGIGSDGGGGGDDGGSSGSSGGGSSGGSGTGVKECADTNACGPAPASPAMKCDDGSLGGFTGRCLQDPSGKCSWEFRDCPKPAACFDATGNTLDPQYRKCASDIECATIQYSQDCCGTQRIAGVTKAELTDASICAKNREATLPKCGCAAGPDTADDGSTAIGPTPGTPPVVWCNPGTSMCETSYKAEQCGGVTCKPDETCCSGSPVPKPYCSTGACPVSRRAYKKDITYLTEADRQNLTEDLYRFPLATYRYKSESEADRQHLGFIIDDVSPSPAVMSSGDRVDLYGYTTMTVAALQVQAKELADLRREVADLKRSCGKR
jgi:hypothetical protein